MHPMEHLAKVNSQYMFSTVNTEQARIAMTQIFKLADHSVKIYDHGTSGNLSTRHPYFFLLVERFLLDGKNLKILLRDNKENTCQITDRFLNLSDKYPDQLIMHLTSDELQKELGIDLTYNTNFTLNDNHAFHYALTAGIDNNPDNVEAVCCFNSKDVTGRLDVIFDQQFDSSATILPKQKPSLA